MTSFTTSRKFPRSAKELYDAWLDGDTHAAMTGGDARCEAHVDGEFEAWDGYIWGKNLELEDGKRIKQSWRTTEFADNDDDSVIELTFEEEGNGTTLTLVHTNIPEGQPDYNKGWDDHYFNPMTEYFSS